MMFGDRLKLLREEKGLTQQNIADILKVERPTIAGYETNRKQPDYEKINLLADYFNVSLDYLLGRSAIRNPYDTNLSHKTDKPTEKTDLEKAENFAENLLDLLIDSGKIQSPNDLSPENIVFLMEFIDSYIFKNKPNSEI